MLTLKQCSVPMNVQRIIDKICIDKQRYRQIWGNSFHCTINWDCSIDGSSGLFFLLLNLCAVCVWQGFVQFAVSFLLFDCFSFSMYACLLLSFSSVSPQNKRTIWFYRKKIKKNCIHIFVPHEIQLFRFYSNTHSNSLETMRNPYAHGDHREMCWLCFFFQTTLPNSCVPLTAVAIVCHCVDRNRVEFLLRVYVCECIRQKYRAVPREVYWNVCSCVAFVYECMRCICILFC